MAEHAPAQPVQAPVPQAQTQQANAFHLQRKCACGSYGAGGECDKCRHDGRKMQRPAVNETTPDAVPSIVHDVLGSSGQPLDSATRAWMEPSFGHDFSNVRVHTDARAAESAQAVNAVAYTVGRDVVFGAGQYSPRTLKGTRLLAHELTHVVQQDMAGGSTSQFSRPISQPSDSSEIEADTVSNRVLAGEAVAVRQPPSAVLHGQLSPEVVTGLEIGGAIVGGALLGLAAYGLYSLLTRLSPAEKQARIANARTNAQTWMGAALTKLNAFIANPSAHTPEIDAARQALQDHFHATDATTATSVRDRLTNIQGILTNWSRMSLVIHDESDLQCRSANAYVGSNPNQIVFCPMFFDADDVFRATSIIHELAHTLTGGSHITDRGYQRDRVYPILNTAEALTNAESFALFVRGLGGPSRATVGGPGDTGEDCPADWKSLLDVAVGRGQRWNRNAQVALADRNQAWVSSITPLLNRHLGGATPAIMDAALGVYTSAADALDSAVDFECEPQGGGRCDTLQTYWYAVWSDFHICPSWRNIGSEDDRIESLLRGFYGYAAGIGDDAQRQSHARLARCLTHTNADWQTPGAAADPAC
ncbi:MAG TPA: DUF4157 domain-containing protein [Pyrinomonadaceae bacterium]|nr:DUF4157 domain-containing protein [Pyrinomonadaceae bacterium]